MCISTTWMGLERRVFDKNVHRGRRYERYICTFSVTRQPQRAILSSERRKSCSRSIKIHGCLSTPMTFSRYKHKEVKRIACSFFFQNKKKKTEERKKEHERIDTKRNERLHRCTRTIKSNRFFSFFLLPFPFLFIFFIFYLDRTTRYDGKKLIDAC